ncbi:thiamine phosphate synthase [Methyloligella sp. 2.7D]|uniref:thiamine phosphate synthase n=1 Tax=unclassified Methyloligella TaxID=2625955 RepID=UPI00157D2248|nr:thiamine phosphate synthase [Methyloligella sp. GL2]QKP76737.1 thiamine phosphate synthase [Methyloligella sp. GL2]
MLKLDPFYPIVPDATFAKRLVPQGVKFLQLRIKEASQETIETDIAETIRLCAEHDCVLVINDYWREAIAFGADFIHLGQEDLADADLNAIKQAGLKLGVSTHSLDELDTALAAEPDYVALGPVYETKLKKMAWDPQGLPRLSEWRAKIGIPLVAIGGITCETVAGVLEAGADSAAVVTDIIRAEDPEARTREWIEATAPWRI